MKIRIDGIVRGLAGAGFLAAAFFVAVSHSADMVLAAEPANAAAGPVVQVDDPLAPTASGSVCLTGVLGRRIDALIQNSVMSQEIERLVRPYREKREVGDGDWRTEYWGKWATSAALACRYEPTPAHLAVLAKAVQELLATKDADGYLGTRKPEHHLKGWDVWGRKYVLLGLLANYDVTGDKAVLDAARRHADTLLAECGPGKANIAAIGYPHWKGLPPSSILEPMVLLYERTGEKKYLEFAEYIVGQWNQPNHWSPNGLRLVEDAIAGKPAAQMGDAPKAYEMMSCYEGLCELYRATGKKQYLEAPVKLAESIFRDELTIIGTGSANEVWCGGRNKQCDNGVLGMETCVTVTWMKLCVQLLRLTGDPQYADALETSLYNALLGALAPDGQWWAYFTLLQGERVASHQQHKDIGTSCCVVNGPRSMLLTPCWAVMIGANGPAMNLYNSGTAEVRLRSGNRVRLVQETDYPVADLVTVKVHPEKSEAFTLSLRIPAWSEQTLLRVNGEKSAVEVKPGTYARIERTWNDGDTVELQLDLRGRAIAEPTGKGFVALGRGPIVLALDSRLVSMNSPTALSVERTQEGRVSLTANPQAAAKHGLWMAFDAVFTEKDGVQRTLTLCDFASAGNTWNDKTQYRVWLSQPLDMATVWQNMPQWWKETLPGMAKPELPPVAK